MLSISELQAIKQQIERHWNIPIGAQNAGDIQITLYIALSIDGSVEQVKLIERICPASNGIVCQASIDSAIRAVWLASPFQDLSQARYDSWREFQITCDPSNIGN